MGTSTGGWRRAAQAGALGAVALALAACDLGAPPVSVSVSASEFGREVFDAGDVDNDGDVDVVVGNDADLGGADPLPGAYSVVLADGDGYTVDRVDAGFAAWSEVVLADVDEDGHLDLIGADVGSLERPAAVHLLVGAGDGTFGSPVVVHEGPGAVEVVDMDDDGHLDLVVVGPDVQVRLGDGSGAFGAAQASPVTPLAAGQSLRDTDVLAAEVDGAPGIDLVVPYSVWDCSQRACDGPDGLAILPGDGAGGVGADTNVGGPAVGLVRQVDVADLDGDGDADVLAADRGALRASLNDGDGAFSVGPVTVLPEAEGACRVQVEDVDGDGTPDAVVAGYGPRGFLLTGAGDGTFAHDRRLVTAGGRPEVGFCNGLLVADLVGDAGLDTAFLSGEADVLKVLENRL